MFHELVKKYKNKSYRQIMPYVPDLLKHLPKIKAEEITSVEDGKNYIELLKKIRQATAETYEWHGRKFFKFLQKDLTAGESGIYSDSLRFIFELIQNVDDCDYEKTDLKPIPFSPI